MAYPKFQEAGAEVIGVSPDDSETLRSYAEKKKTPFTFVSDRSRSIAAAFGMEGRRQARVSFVIKRGGLIAGVSKHEFRVPKHVSDTLSLVQSLG